MNEGTLGNWVNRAREAAEGTRGLSTDHVTELKRLRAEVAELRMERDVLKRSVVLWVKEVSVARFIADQRTSYRVPHTVVCALLGVSLTWFYKWLGRAQEPGALNGLHTDRDRRRDTIDQAVAVAFRKARGLHGSPRLHADLLEAGWKVSEKTVADSKRGQGLIARRIKRRTPQCHQSRTVRVHAVPPCWSMAGLSSLDAVANWNDSGVDGELVVATYHYTHPVRSVLSPASAEPGLQAAVVA